MSLCLSLTSHPPLSSPSLHLPGALWCLWRCLEEADRVCCSLHRSHPLTLLETEPYNILSAHTSPFNGRGRGREGGEGRGEERMRCRNARCNVIVCFAALCNLHIKHERTVSVLFLYTLYVAHTVPTLYVAHTVPTLYVRILYLHCM